MNYLELKNKILKDISKDPEVIKGLSFWQKNKKSLTYENAQAFSKTLGNATAKALQVHTPELSGEELAAFAEGAVKPVYRHTQDIMVSYCNDVVRSLNSSAGIKYAPNVTEEVSADVSGMLDNLVKRFQEAAEFDEVRFLTEGNAAKSITRKSTSSHMKYTSRAQQSVGLHVLISRDEGTGCCDYCSGLTGTFESYDDLPSDFWSVHRNCTCVFHYKVGKTSSKIRFDTDEKGNISKIEEAE